MSLTNIVVRDPEDDKIYATATKGEESFENDTVTVTLTEGIAFPPNVRPIVGQLYNVTAAYLDKARNYQGATCEEADNDLIVFSVNVPLP